jgi:hypothetical protein
MMNVDGNGSSDVAGNLIQNIQALKGEVNRLHGQLKAAQVEREWSHFMFMIYFILVRLPVII